MIESILQALANWLYPPGVETQLAFGYELWIVAALVVVSAALSMASLFIGPGDQRSSSQGPRLDDQKITTSTYGKGINKLYGTHRLGGNLIWTSGIDEIEIITTRRVRGKGGGGSQTFTQTTYLYYANLAVGFAEGVVEGLLKVFLNGKLVYDSTGLTVFNKANHDFIWFSGTDDQDLPSFVGAAQYHRYLDGDHRLQPDLTTTRTGTGAPFASEGCPPRYTYDCHD